MNAIRDKKNIPTYHPLLQSLDQETLIITANQRLTSYLIEEYINDHSQTSVWEKPHILPLSAWLKNIWQSHGNLYCLSPTQSKTLWHMIINKHLHLFHHPLPKRMISLALETWETLQLWCIDWRSFSSNYPLELDYFVKYAQLWEAYLRKQRWITEAELPIFIPKVLKKINLPKKIYLAGFDHLSPAIDQLFSQVQKLIPVITVNPTFCKTAKVVRVSCYDSTDEIITMAKWAKACYEKNKNDPNHRIGCIIPDLSKIRHHVLTVFNEVFAPPHTLISHHTTAYPFNLSLGEVMSETLMIKTALTLLRLNPNKIGIKDFHLLLLSPYITLSSDDQYYASQIDIQLRQLGILEFTLKDFMNAAQLLKLDYPNSTIANRLSHFLKQIQHPQPMLSLHDWVNHITECLSHLGWPGRRTLNSYEYQLYQQWETCLLEFSTLDFLVPELPHFEAVQELTTLCQTTIFQPQTIGKKKIQILGLLEATGLYFDDLWMMGLDHHSWPKPAKPNPFIPQVIQKKYQMPHATPERELLYSQQKQAYFTQAATQVVFSHAEQVDGQSFHASALISHIPQVETKDIPQANYVNPAIEIHQTQSLIYYNDNSVGPLSKQENIRGGSKILTYQSQCPFRGFAAIRLKVNAFERPLWGIAPHTQGALLHRALQLLGNRVSSAIELQSLSPQTKDNMIQSIVNTTLSQYSLKKITKKVEAKRLYLLLQEWITLEEQRSSFQIDQIEKEYSVNIGPLDLKIKVDRIDQIKKNQYLLIDYKSGKNNNIHHWFSDPLKSPQLPLYCITLPLNIMGVAFAEVKRGHMRLKGITFSDTACLPHLKKIQQYPHPLNSAAAIKSHWKQLLVTISESFFNGETSVTPIDSSICDTCQMHSFCRIRNRQYV